MQVETLQMQILKFDTQFVDRTPKRAYFPSQSIESWISNIMLVSPDPLYLVYSSKFCDIFTQFGWISRWFAKHSWFYCKLIHVATWTPNLRMWFLQGGISKYFIRIDLHVVWVRYRSVSLLLRETSTELSFKQSFMDPVVIVPSLL